MSAGPKDKARDNEEAAAILELIPRAEWSNPRLQGIVVWFLSNLDVGGLSIDVFVRGHLPSAMEAYFKMPYFDGGSRNAIRAAFRSLIRAREAERAALSQLHVAGVGCPFDAAPRGARSRLLDQEIAIARGHLERLGGRGRDKKRPARAFARILADAWDLCGGSQIHWNGYPDPDDPDEPDQHPFCELVRLIFDDMRDASRLAGAEPTPTILAGAPRGGSASQRIPARADRGQYSTTILSNLGIGPRPNKGVCPCTSCELAKAA